MDEMEKITRALNKYSDALIQIPGVNGVYVGQNESEELVIRIMVDRKTDSLLEKILKHLDGFPVEFEETGKIKPM